MTDRRPLAVLLLGACIIGASPILVRLTGAGPAATGFWRLALALPLLAVMSVRAGGVGRPSRAMLWAGGFFAADLAFWHYGIHYTSVANATVLSNLTPILVTAVSWTLFKEKPRALFLAGMAVAVGGAVAMGLARHGGVGPGSRPALGDLLSAATAVWYGAYFLAVRQARAAATTTAVMLWTAMVGLAPLAAVALALKEPLWPAAAGGWAAAAGLGLMHVTGQGAIAWALGRLPASLTAVVVLVQPVVAAALGWLAFREAVTPWQAAGGVATLAGVALAQAAARPRPPPPAPTVARAAA